MSSLMIFGAILTATIVNMMIGAFWYSMKGLGPYWIKFVLFFIGFIFSHYSYDVISNNSLFKCLFRWSGQIRDLKNPKQKQPPNDYVDNDCLPFLVQCSPISFDPVKSYIFFLYLISKTSFLWLFFSSFKNQQRVRAAQYVGSIADDRIHHGHLLSIGVASHRIRESLLCGSIHSHGLSLYHHICFHIYL